MEQRTAWVIDDEEMWRDQVTKYLSWNGSANGLTGPNFAIRKFETVDAALKELEGLKPEDYPTLISTDGNTKSSFGGVDMAIAAKDKGIPVVVVSGERDIADNLKRAGCPNARYIDKAKFGKKELYELCDAAIADAGVVKGESISSPAPLNQSDLFDYLVSLQAEPIQKKEQAQELLNRQKSFVKEALRMFAYAASPNRTTGMDEGTKALMPEFKEYHLRAITHAMSDPERFARDQNDFYEKIHAANIPDADKLGFEFLLGLTRFEILGQVNVQFADYLKAKEIPAFVNLNTDAIKQNLESDIRLLPKEDIADRLRHTASFSTDIIDRLSSAFVGKEGEESYWHHAQAFFDANPETSKLCKEIVSMQYMPGQDIPGAKTPGRIEMMTLAQMLHWNGFGGNGEFLTELAANHKDDEEFGEAYRLLADLSQHSIGYFGTDAGAPNFNSRMLVFRAALGGLKSYVHEVNTAALLKQFGEEQDIKIYDMGSGNQDAVGATIQNLKQAGKNPSLDISEINGQSLVDAITTKEDKGNPNAVEQIYYLDLNGKLQVREDQKDKYHLTSYGVVLHQLPEAKHDDALRYAVEMTKAGGFISNPDVGEGREKQAMLIPGNLVDREGFVRNNNAKVMDFAKLAVDTGTNAEGVEMVKIPVPLIGLEKESGTSPGTNNGIYSFQSYQVISFPKGRLAELSEIWNKETVFTFANKEEIAQNPALIKKEAYALIAEATAAKVDLLAFQSDIRTTLDTQRQTTIN